MASHRGVHQKYQKKQPHKNTVSRKNPGLFCVLFGNLSKHGNLLEKLFFEKIFYPESTN